ncbi:glycosyltransferase [Pseudokineococcus marinus]|uniref:Glycosyltransferase n=1 Tax=Pseudokineococcus marinus TaxID=351215 RepID=A0A849BQR8_9ACTN|nr:glycosyltransferase [Pseudokineococcus marinus]NNH21886.1 glycosyltransferase [Pseudokineococcus marinus]
MPRVRTVVVIPAGPRDDVLDTVDSVLTHLGPSRHVVVVDDTRGARPEQISSLASTPDVTLLEPRSRGEGVYGSLWVKLAEALVAVLDVWDFDLLVRLDADALLIGPGLEDAALAVLDADRSLGLLGSYRTASDGSQRSFAPARELLRQDLHWRNAYGDPRLRRAVVRLRRSARRHGYEDGEHVLGACSLLPQRAIERMRESGLLQMGVLANSAMGDDHLMGLGVRAAGLTIGDFGRPGDPIAVRWKGLPAAPADLLARGVAVTHSVRSYEGATGAFEEDVVMGEEEIRSAFRRARRREAGS